ncbi:MAG: hypothetical protein DRI44_03710 [Chlamydiae bacterium]|nr:MAG: hypothetical protein DRI44_03710 [Chlamydiota bacterium]
MNNTLKRLLDLQNLDKEIIEIQREKNNIIEKLREEQMSYQKSADDQFSLKEDKIQMEVDKKKLELNIEDAELKIKHLEENQALVKKNKEYQALSKEIKEALAAKENAKEALENHIKQTEENAVDLEKGKKQVDDIKQDLLKKADEVKMQLLELQGKFKRYKSIRNDITKDINDKYLSIYNNLYKKRAPRIIVQANKSMCGGCHISLPAQIIADIMSLKEGDNLVMCENCGRILYIENNEELAE